MYRRFRALDALKVRSEGEGDGKKDVLDIRASTDEPVNWGDWSEVLSHEPDAVDAASARALLINHNRDMIAGAVETTEFDGSASNVRARLIPGARMESNVSVADAINSGALRGVSCGYTYRMEDTEWDEESRTLYVKKWSMREVTLTPTPADTNAMVRSLPDEITKAPRKRAMPDPVKPADQKPDENVTHNLPVDADALRKQERDAARAEAKEIAALARSVGLNADDFVGMSKADAQAAMLKARAEKDAEKRPEPQQAATPAARVGEEHAEKQRDAFAEATMVRVGLMSKADGNPYVGRSFMESARYFARANGVRGAEDWTKRDLAHYVLGESHHMSGRRDAANIINANFPNFVTLNAVTKTVAKGFEMGSPTITYSQLVETQRVPDFKSFYIGGLGTGNLQKTAENIAFPELVKSEATYNDTAKMWGGTLSLTLQALINDDTAQFDRSLRMAGVIAQKTIDRRVYEKLLLGTSTSSSTWTSNTTSGCSPVYTTADTLAAARAKINLGIAALMNKGGADGNPLGTVPAFFVAGPTSGAYIAGLLNAAPGQTVSNSYANGMKLVISPWLEASALSGYSTTSFYVLGAPGDVTGLVLSLISGYESPQVQEYDPGAVGARNWKIWMPFEADLFWFTDPDGSTKRIPAAQQCTT